jgi:hypothetical protein
VLAAALGTLLMPPLPLARAGGPDVYTIDHNFGRADLRDRYSYHVLKAALAASSAQYGPYALRTAPLAMERDRLLQEMLHGKRIGVSAQISSAEWEQKLIPIRIPVDKGLSGYRISLIDGRRQSFFSAVRTLAQLKRIPLGTGRQWSSTAVFQDDGFSVALGNSTAGLHSMLAADRFQHFPRSMEEAVYEQAAYVGAFPELALERSFVIYMPLPRYFFVAPDQPRLAERIEAGLRAMIADGSFDRIFHQFYDGLIAQVGLRKRRLFRLENRLLSPQTPLANRAYWYEPLENR